MKRKPGSILPIEEAILSAAVDLRRRGQADFHGFAIAKRMQEIGEASQLTAHGTLYKALGRMSDAGFLGSEWEDPDEALREGRPRRRLYRITGLGEKALATARLERKSQVKRGLAST